MKNFLITNMTTAFFLKCSLFGIFESQLTNRQQKNYKILKEVDFVALAPSYVKHCG